MTDNAFRLALRRGVAALAIAAAFARPLAAAEFTKHELYFELNATDGDVGLHGLLDGEAWSKAKISGPGGTFHVVRAFANSESPKFGLTELFFESNEPPLEDRSFAELTAQFPPGVYEFSGATPAGDMLTGADRLTADMPCPPVLKTPRVKNGELALSWRLQPGGFDPDTGVCSHSGGVIPVLVQAFVSVADIATGNSRTFAVDMPPAARSVEVPDEFLAGVDPDAVEAKAEVLVIEQSGNRTAVEVEFEL